MRDTSHKTTYMRPCVQYNCIIFARDNLHNTVCTRSFTWGCVHEVTTVIRAMMTMKKYNWHYPYKSHNATRITMTTRLMRFTRAMTDTWATMKTRILKDISAKIATRAMAALKNCWSYKICVPFEDQQMNLYVAATFTPNAGPVFLSAAHHLHFSSENTGQGRSRSSS